MPYIGFGLVALLAIGFATFALWRKPGKGRPLLAGAVALFLVGVGGGTYWMVGEPGIALRSARGLGTRDINGLIPFLIERVRKQPGDLEAWSYLGRAYMTAGDARDAANAFGRAVAVARRNGREDTALESAYGEALVEATGAVNDEALAAFTAVLARDPKDGAARFFLGQARAERGDKEGALSFWQPLLAEVPANAPLHQLLVDRIALLTAQGAAPGGAPDPRQMVAGLAARLKQNPDDAQGWERLIRAYSVLGQTDDARQALATARKTFANDKDVMAGLETEARELKLN
ncbi:MAG TPA: tetratricopeptide repeat protein [Rhizomicrobium sp.]|nr:tetratricopeptide repeat protein [Rhizomicrobium sp.]